MTNRFVIGTLDKLHLVSFDGEDTSQVERTVNVNGEVKALAFLNEQVMVTSTSAVSAYTPDLEPSTARFSVPFAAVVDAGAHVFLAGEGSIVVCDDRGSDIGRTVLVDGRKDAHDLLFRAPRIYALDNIVLPVFTVLVNGSVLRRPEFVHRHTIEGIYPHLDAQFLDPEGKLWFVFEGYGARQHLPRCYGRVTITLNKGGPRSSTGPPDQPTYQSPFTVWPSNR